MRIPGGGESLIADGMRSLGANRLTLIHASGTIGKSTPENRETLSQLWRAAMPAAIISYTGRTRLFFLV